MSLLKHAATVSSYTFLSRVLGFVRDILIAVKLGTGIYADVFFVAFKIPNLFRRLFAEGALNAAFVPLFSGKLSSKGKLDAQRFAENILSFLVIFLLILTMIMQIAMPWILQVVAPGFVSDPEKYDLTVLLTRITFPYLLFISISALCGGVLNSLSRFAEGAFSPVILNLCLIGGILALAHVTETPAHALAYSASVAGVLQLVWMMTWCWKAGIKLKLRKPKLTSEVKLLLKRMVPGMIGAGVVQINVWIDIILATLIPGAVSLLYYADRLNQFPLALIGTAIGIVLLPLLSKQIKEERYDDAITSQNRALEFAMLLTIPAAVALTIIAFPLIYVMFGYGAFTQENARQAAYALSAYGIGLPAFVLIKVLAPSFFARGDTVTPVKIAVACVMINIILSLAWIGPLAHVGLALATTVAALCNATALGVFLYRKKRLKPDARLKKCVIKIIVATITMAGILLITCDLLSEYLVATLVTRIAALVVIIVSGIVSYAAMVLITKAFSMTELKAMLERDRS